MGFLEQLRALFGLQRKASLLVLGLENSGKTTIVKRLKADRKPLEVVPTVGFSVEKFGLEGLRFTVMDMSGQAKYRKLWECYFKDVQAVVFVLDSSDRPRLHAAKDLLDGLLGHPDLSGLPLLVLTNKVDLVQAVPANQVAQTLALDRPEVKRPWHVTPSSGVTGEGLEDGMRWVGQQIRAT